MPVPSANIAVAVPLAHRLPALMAHIVQSQQMMPSAPTADRMINQVVTAESMRA
jgi:hypothetical protein